MGRIDAASLAYERSVLATNPAAARAHSNIYHRQADRSIPLVRRPDSRRLLPTSTALADAGGTGRLPRLMSADRRIGWKAPPLMTCRLRILCGNGIQRNPL